MGALERNKVKKCQKVTGNQIEGGGHRGRVVAKLKQVQAREVDQNQFILGYKSKRVNVYGISGLPII